MRCARNMQCLYVPAELYPVRVLHTLRVLQITDFRLRSALNTISGLKERLFSIVSSIDETPFKLKY